MNTILTITTYIISVISSYHLNKLTYKRTKYTPVYPIVWFIPYFNLAITLGLLMATVDIPKWFSLSDYIKNKWNK